MKIALYSSTRRATGAGQAKPSRHARRSGAPQAADSAPVASGVPATAATPPAATRWARLQQRYPRATWMGFGASTAAVAIAVFALISPAGQRLTQRDIDLAVLHTLKNQPKPPATAAIAYDAIRPSVVRVRQFGMVDDEHEPKPKAEGGKEGGRDKPKDASKDGPKDGPKDGRAKKPGDPPKAVAEPAPAKKGTKEVEVATGTGVVIVDSGIILTSLHVVAGGTKIGVVFADGTESDAEIINTQPWNDMAVLQAKTVPDDLKAATLRSTRGLRPGDEVMAVGYPFGLGPSLSAGVVSGLKREFDSPEGKVKLRNLIQFDTAANPGNSGGPLVTGDGSVVGIVTAILNPKDRVFIGIGFAVPIENAAAAVGSNPF